MLKNHFLFSLLFCFTLSFFSQTNDEYVGGVLLNDSLTIPYRISFKEAKGVIKGYSVTDLGGDHETRSNIFGEYDVKTRRLSFREVGIIYTKSTISQNDFCFLNTTLKNFTLGKTKRAQANFVGLFSDNTKCINGELLLNSLEKVEKRVQKVTSKINKSKKIADSIKQKFNATQMLDGFKMNILRKATTLSVFTKSSSVKLTIFDGGKLDGDNISITANGEYILNNYEATKTKKILYITLKTPKTSIQIKANNEGDISPNTVIVVFEDEENSIKALSNLKQGETTQIDILKH